MTADNIDKRVSGIDLLRGVAAIGVAAFHLYSQNLGPALMELFPEAAHLLLMWGRWGVQLFFVISGFVILYTLDERRNFDRPIDLFIYFCRRLCRLDILYICILIFYLISRLYFSEWIGYPFEPLPELNFNFVNVLKNIFYFLPVEGTLLLPVAWTLAIEVQFYLFMAALFICINRFKLNRYTERIIVAVSFVSLLWPLRVFNVEIGFWLFPSLFNLLSGAMVYFLLYRRTSFSIFANAFFMVLLLAIFLLSGKTHVLATLASYILVVATLTFLPQIISNNPVSRILGECSYGVYLLHQLVGFMLVTPLARAAIPFISSGPVLLVLGMATTILLAFFLFHLVEKPSVLLSKRIQRTSGDVN